MNCTGRILLDYLFSPQIAPCNLAPVRIGRLRIISTSGPRYRCLVRDSTGAYASPHIELTLPASTHHPSSNSRYRRLLITTHRTHATGAYASLRTMPTLPAPTHHSAPCPRYRRLRITTHRTHATGAYASPPASDSRYRRLRYRRIRPTLLALMNHSAPCSRYRRLRITSASDSRYRRLHVPRIRPTLPALMNHLAPCLRYRRLRITPHIGFTLPAPTHHLRIRPTLPASTHHLRIRPTLPALTNHPAPCLRYRRLRITPHHAYATGVYASPPH